MEKESKIGKTYEKPTLFKNVIILVRAREGK